MASEPIKCLAKVTAMRYVEGDPTSCEAIWAWTHGGKGDHGGGDDLDCGTGKLILDCGTMWPGEWLVNVSDEWLIMTDECFRRATALTSPDLFPHVWLAAGEHGDDEEGATDGE